jgi:hypothetical protein
MFREPYEALLIREKSDINFFAKLRVSVKAGDQEAKEGTRRPPGTPKSPRHPKVGPDMGISYWVLNINIRGAKFRTEYAKAHEQIYMKPKLKHYVK